jgi:hypothetical protein
MSNLIEKFLVMEPQGVCTDDSFEFGNLHRKSIRCSFCINGECHYIGECDRRDIPDQNLGWRIT